MKRWLEDREWWVARAAGSLGDADLVALKGRPILHRPLLIEVKSSAQGPYEHFGPAARQRLLEAANLAGATAVLAYWPPHGELRFIYANEWPDSQQKVAA